jgi:hypothetical protein
MTKKSLLHRFKSYNTIKLVTLILLLVLPLVGILAYNKSLFEGMVINIYGCPNGSGTISTSNDNNSNTNSNTNSNSNENDNSNSNTQEIYTPPPPDTVADPTPTPAPKSSLADNASSNVDSAKAKANDTKDAISKKTSSYTSAFTNPLQQTQSTT